MLLSLTPNTNAINESIQIAKTIKLDYTPQYQLEIKPGIYVACHFADYEFEEYVINQDFINRSNAKYGAANSIEEIELQCSNEINDPDAQYVIVLNGYYDINNAPNNYLGGKLKPKYIMENYENNSNMYFEYYLFQLNLT